MELSRAHTQLQAINRTLIRSTTLRASVTPTCSFAELTADYEDVSPSKKIGMKDNKIFTITLLIIPRTLHTVALLIATLLVDQIVLS